MPTIIWTSAWLLLIRTWETNFSETLIGIPTFSSKKICLKMSYEKWRPLCIDLNVDLNATLIKWKWTQYCKCYPVLFTLPLCVLFCNHPIIWVTNRKPSNWCNVHNFVAIGDFKLELLSRNAQLGSQSANFAPHVLEIWQMALRNNRVPLLRYSQLCV